MNISSDKLTQTCTWLRKGNFKRETKYLQIATQNNTIRTNYVEAKIDKTQQNSKCTLCGDRDEIINHIISEWSKLTQREYKTRHDSGGEGDSLGIVQEIEIWPYYEMVYAQIRIRPGEWDTQDSLGFEYKQIT